AQRKIRGLVARLHGRQRLTANLPQAWSRLPCGTCATIAARAASGIWPIGRRQHARGCKIASAPWRMAAAADLFPRVPTSPASFPLSSPPSFQASFFLLFLRPVVSAQVGRLPASAREPALRAEVQQQQASVLGCLNSRVEAGRERSARHCR